MKEAKYSRRSPHREEIQPIYEQAGPRLWLAEEDDVDGILHREPKEEQETPTTNAEESIKENIVGAELTT